MLEEIKKRAEEWLNPLFDKETRNEVENLIKNNEEALIDSFYKDLEFGTGGLRGIMGAGTNRMNKYTIGMATQGLSNYLKSNFKELEQIKVVVAHDCRNNSRLFAETVAAIFSANNFKVYLFEDLRPTPELSFAIRHFNCQSGVVITASHNPKEYNGFKAYWEDGAQLIAPHDINVVKEAKKVNISDILFDAKNDNIEILSNDFDDIYLEQLKTLSLNPEIIKKHSDLKIVFTPIHGTAVKIAPKALQKFGFNNIISVDKQNIVDGNFPTVKSPNPENAEALQMAIDKAKENNAELVMATDPDSDRVGIAVLNNENQFELLNGNQTGALLIYYLLNQWKEKGKLTGKEYIVKTIVTTGLLSEIALDYNVKCHNVLTGFKYIADIIAKNEGEKTFIGGGEESYGYLAGEFVRDKDAIMSVALIAETAAWAKENGKTLYQLLHEIYLKYGLFVERLVNIVKKGKQGDDEIQKIMDDLRNDSPVIMNDSKVTEIKDYYTQKHSNLFTGRQFDIDLPKSNVLQFFLEDGSTISVRPSGTEPKIKFYFSVSEKIKTFDEIKKTQKMLNDRIDAIIKSLKI